MVSEVNLERNQPNQRAASHTIMPWRPFLRTMNTTTDRFTTKTNAKIGQPARAQIKGSPVIE